MNTVPITVLVMQRDKNDTVTNTVTTVPILVPPTGREKARKAMFFDGWVKQDKGAFVVQFDEKKAFKRLLPSKQTRFIATTMLKDAIWNEDERLLGKALNLMDGIEDDGAKAIIEGWAKNMPLGARRELLAREVTRTLAEVRLVLWWTGEAFTPALYCRTPEQGLYVQLLMKVSKGDDIGVCPHCCKFFVKKRRDQQYCSIRHREAHRVARWREAKKTLKGKRSRTSKKNRKRK